MTGAATRFAALQRRLADLPATRLEDLGRRHPITVVGLPSIDFGDAFAQRSDVAALETRWLYLLLLLRRPHARVAIVTSEPIDEEILAHHLELVGDVPDLDGRLALFTVADVSPQPLAAKLLEHQHVVSSLRAFTRKEPAFIHPFSALGLAERDAALALDIPILGIDVRFAAYASKSGGRALLAAAGVPVPRGTADLRGAAEVAHALVDVRRDDPTAPAAVVKLDQGVTGSGNAIVALDRLPPRGSLAERRALKDRLAALDAGYVAALADGAVVEELVDARASPSIQVAIAPDGSVEALSVHDQVLDGPLGHTYVGCRFPATGVDADALAAHGVAVGRRLADEGAVGRFAVDFVVDGDGRALAVEVNPREGATTHPWSTLTLLEGPAGFLRASDGVPAPGLGGWQEAVAAVRDAGLAYDPERGAGAILHMLNGVARTGRIGVVALGTTAEQAEAVFDGTAEALRVRAATRAIGHAA